MTPRNTNNSADDEFGFDYGMSEDEFNKRHRKALKKADSSYREKKPKSKKKDKWIKIGDGVYQNIRYSYKPKKKSTKKKKKLYEPNPLFRGLGGGGSSKSKGPWYP